MITRNLREWVTLSLVFFGFIYLSGDAKNDIKANLAKSDSGQIVLISGDKDKPLSNDVSGSDTPTENSHDLLLETNYVGQFSDSFKKVVKNNSQFANQSPCIKTRYNKESKSTLSSVDSDLAHQFTLLGEKPSGTS